MECSGSPAAGHLVKATRWWGPQGALGLEDACSDLRPPTPWPRPASSPAPEEAGPS